MRKSKPNQLTGREETPGEREPQRALLLCCWAPPAGGITGAEDGAAPETGLAVGLVVGQDGPQGGASEGGWVGG